MRLASVLLAASITTLSMAMGAEPVPGPAGQDPTRPEPFAALLEGAISYAGSALWTGMNDVAVRDGYAYCVMPYGLMVLDISDASMPHRVSRQRLPGSGRGIDLSGDFAFVADSLAGLQIIDVSHPAVPLWVGEYDTPGAAEAVCVESGLAFVADGNSGLHVIDVTSPSSPEVVASLSPPFHGLGYFIDLDIVGDRLYVIDYEFHDLHVCDISDPINPEWMGTSNIEFRPVDLSVADTIAYVATDGRAFDIVDVSDDWAPYRLFQFGTLNKAWAVDVVDDLAYLATEDRILRVLDVSDPSAPDSIGAMIVGTALRSVAVVDGLLYGAGDYGDFHIVDVDPPTALAVVGILEFAEYSVTDLELSPGHAHAHVLTPTGLFTLDTAESTLDEIGYFGPVSGAHGLTTDGPFVYIANRWPPRFYTLDLSDPAHATHVVTFELYRPARDVEIAGSRLYVSMDDSLRAFDISDPLAPQPLGALRIAPYWGFRLDVQDDLVFVAAVEGGLYIVDFTNPLNPRLSDHLMTPGNSYDVEVDGDYAYVAGHGAGLLVVDVTDPREAVLVSTFDTPGECARVHKTFNHVFVGDGSQGVLAIDVSDPMVPVAVASYNTSGYSLHMAVACNRLFVADHAGALKLNLDWANGDINSDCLVRLDDIIHLIEHVFKSGPPPLPGPKQGDLDCNSSTDVRDIMMLVNYVLRGGVQPECFNASNP